MSFVYPQFLWALVVLAIPVIIHLFSFRRTIRVFFSNTRLLRQIRQETTQRRKLKQYLILASRLLFLFFLVMAFAQPFRPAIEQLTPGKDMVIYIDNSFSMSAPVGEKTRALDRAIDYVRELVGLFPTDTRFKLLTNDFAPASNSFKTKAEVSDQLSQLRLSPISRTTAEIIRRVGTGTGTDVFWISDFQKSTLGVTDKAVVDSLHSWHLIPITLGSTSNVLVDSVRLENPFMISGEKNTVIVHLRQSGSKRIEGLVVKLTINGIQSATASVNLEPNSTAEISFDITSSLLRRNEARITFNDFPVSFDNQFYFTLNFSDKINITEIRDPLAGAFLEKVYANKGLFNFRTLRSRNVNYSQVTQSDLVVLNGLNTIDAALVKVLSDFQSGGGTLLIIPGPAPDISQYKNLISWATLKVADAGMPVEMERPDFQNPFFENVFEEKSLAMAMPKATRVLDWGGDRTALLKLKNGQPFLSQNQSAYLLACPLESSYTDFQQHALFVPVMYRLAATGKKWANRAYYTLQEDQLKVRADSLKGEDPVKLVGAQEVIPPQRRAEGLALLEIPRFAMTTGYYYVMNRLDTLDLVAFNLSKEESLLEQLKPEEARAALGGGKQVTLFKASSTNTFSNEIKERYLGTPWWKQALVLALLFLLAEVLLIRFLK